MATVFRDAQGMVLITMQKIGKTIALEYHDALLEKFEQDVKTKL